jgi:hypothetical protein
MKTSKKRPWPTLLPPSLPSSPSISKTLSRRFKPWRRDNLHQHLEDCLLFFCPCHNPSRFRRAWPKPVSPKSPTLQSRMVDDNLKRGADRSN